jgi:tetratricopeptide (TPR) repeat protein
MKEVKFKQYKKFYRFLSKTVFTSILLIVLAGLQQSCSITLSNVAGGGSIGNIDANSKSQVIDSDSPTFEDIESTGNLSIQVEEQINKFRQKILEWDSSSPIMSSSLKRELTEIVNKAYREAEKLSKLDHQRARAAFYASYWQDFQERVLKEMTQCRKASSLYGEAIELYKQVFDNKKDISEEEAYILIELAHWLINRDAGPDHHGGFDGYNEALNLLRILSSSPDLEDRIRYNTLVGKGIAKFGQRKNYVSAAADFREALGLYPESSDVTYNLGSMEAYQGNYTQAIAAYELAIEKNQFAELTPLIIRRDLGFAYILQEMMEDPSGSFARYDQAVDEFNKIIQSPDNEPSLKPVAHIGKSLALYNMNKVTEAKNELEKAGGSDFAIYLNGVINRGEKNNPAIIDLIKKVSFGNIVPHDQGADPVLDIYHKLFYCADGDQRIK